ncbi:MAG: hypothetical protein ACJ8LM_13230 [Candidatus Udaeobacter sp.]
MTVSLDMLADQSLPMRYSATRCRLVRDRMQFDQLKRREFITLLGGAAAALPLAARAQQSDRTRRIGLLMGWAESDPEVQPRMAAFMTRLRELGWIDRRNCRIELHWSAGDVERMHRQSKELVASAPDLIVAMKP